MHGINEFFRRLFRTILRLLLITAAAAFLLSLLLATLVVMLGVTVWAVVTGRKPDPARVFGRFRAASARYTRGAWSGGAASGTGAAPNAVDIVDVPAHEIREVPQTRADGANRAQRAGNDATARMQHR